MNQKVNPDMPVSTPVRGLSAWTAVVQAFYACEHALIDGLKPLGLKLAQHEVLMHLAQQGGLTQQELAQRCFVTKSHMSAVLTEMAQRGWVQRAEREDDKRSKRVTLTPAGQHTACDASALQREIIEAMMTPLSDSEVEQMRTLARSTTSGLRAHLARKATAAAEEGGC
jgi:DNA-binding MarR family transcriptional regulator